MPKLVKLTGMIFVLSLFVGNAKADDPVSIKHDSGAEDEMNLEIVHEEINRGFKELEPIFKKGCFDCHTARTEFPWYHKLPLIGGWMNDHIEEGREHLDMTNGFPFEGKGDQVELLNEIRHEIEEGEMPLWSYTIMHGDAEPDSLERARIFKWVELSLKILAAFHNNPADSSENDTE